jgi:hypothetical protein
MAIDKARQFETVCSLTADYVRAYMQNTNFDPRETSFHEEHVAACFHLAQVTIKLFEREFLATNKEEVSGNLH